MEAISQTIEVKNHTFSMVLPKSFTAKSVQVIVLPLNELSLNQEEFMPKIDKPKVRMRDLVGKLSDEDAKGLLAEVADSRKGWERRLAKQF